MAEGRGKLLRPFASYQLSHYDEAELCALARRVGEEIEEGHWLVVGGTRSVAARLGRVCEQRVLDAEFPPLPAESFAVDYAEYEDRSLHVTVVDAEGIAASARIIVSPDIGQPTMLEVDLGYAAGELRAHHRIDERYGGSALTEWATLVIEPRIRASRVASLLIGEVRYQQMCAYPCAPSVALARPGLFRALKSWGHDVEALGGLGPVHYKNHEVQPVFFEPGPQPQIADRSLYGTWSEAWLSRAMRPLTSSVIDLTESASTPAHEGVPIT